MTRSVTDLNELERIPDIFQGVREMEIARNKTREVRQAAQTMVESHEQEHTHLWRNREETGSVRM